MEKMNSPIKKTADMKTYKREWARNKNDKPKMKCDICKKEFKPCSLRAHNKTISHNLTLEIYNNITHQE
jgi:hypothetical protein